MASVTVYSTDKMDELLNAGVVNAAISGGHLILQLRSGATVDAGPAVAVVPDGTTTLKGGVELATDTETITGTDGTVVVTPLGLAALTATATRRGLVELATDAEALTATDTTRAITPANLGSLPKVQVITPVKLETDLPSTYPLGTSLMTLSGTGTLWSLNSGFGFVVTVKGDTVDRTQQTFYSNNGGTGFERMWVRQYHSSAGGGGWTPWSEDVLMASLTAASFVQTTLHTAYPSGWSRLMYTTANSASWGFAGKAGEVLTYVNGALDYAYQQYVKHVAGSAGVTEKWIRTANAALGWTPWRVICRDAKLPDPVLDAAGSSQTLTATAFADLPTTSVTRTLVLPYDAIVRMELGCWMLVGSGGGYARVGINVNNVSPEDVNGGTWGQVIQGAGVSFSGGGFTSITMKLVAGTHTIKTQALKSSAGAVVSVSYVTMRTIVERWAE